MIAPTPLSPTTNWRGMSLLIATPLYVGVVADTFGGLLHGSFPLSLVVRALSLALFLVWVLDSPQTTVRVRMLLLTFMLYLSALLFVRFVRNPVMPLVAMDASSSLRLLYAPLLLGFVAAVMRAGLFTAERARSIAVLFGWLILLSLFLGKATGLGGEIGGRGVDIEAGKGFMIGANEVGLMLILSCPFVVADLLARLRSMALTALIAMLLYSAAGFYVFTKSSLAAPLVCSITLYALSKARGPTTLFIARMILLGALAGISMAVMHFLDIIVAYADTTFFGALLNEGMVSFLFRGRQTYIDALYPQLAGDDLHALFLLFGAGEYSIRQMSLGPLSLGNHEGTNFEMDFFDLIGAYGVAGTALYGILLASILNTLPMRQDLKPGTGFALGAVLVHSFMAGHVVFSPQVMTLVILCFAASVRPASTAMIR